MKNYIFCVLVTVISSTCFAQQKQKLYFLADTSGMNHDKRLSIVYGSPFERSFYFQCGCLNSKQEHFSFALKIGKNFPDQIVDTRPEGKYIGIEELIKLVIRDGYYFDAYHELIIVEPIKGRYRINKVKREVLRNTYGKRIHYPGSKNLIAA